VHYVRSEGRAWIHSGVASPTEDPYILHHVGELDVAIESAASLLDRACDALDECRVTRATHDRDVATVAVSRAKIGTNDAALRATSELFKICGTRSTLGNWGFDRHWRNARTLTLHDPVDYKYRLIGEYVLNRTPPPVSGWT
jgi:alkylation response protein AidB-like acyl-CoA dehydrogenase